MRIAFIFLLSIGILTLAGSAQVDVSQAFYPSGYMGDWGDVSLDENSADGPYSGPGCIKLVYSASQSQGVGRAGVCWQYPDGNPGSEPGRSDLAGNSRITFWAKGAIGGEVVEFSAGGSPSDTLGWVTIGPVTLGSDWQQYTLDLSGRNLESVVNGFCIAMSKQDNPTGCTVYLDDILYE